MRSLKEGSQIKRLHDLLSSNPNGVKITEIVKKFKFTKSKLYDLKHSLLSKGYKVIRTETDMILLPGNPVIRKYNKPFKSTTKVLKDKELKNTPSIGKDFDNRLLKYLPLMSQEDANDCVNFIKKSIFYKKCAESLIESIEYIKKFQN